MKRFLLTLALLTQFPLAQAGFIDYFKDEHGSTNWQYVANFSSGVLIITLSIVALFLFITFRKAQKANRELSAIRADLEQRVEQRTAALRQSETYLNNILRSLPLMLVGLDREGRITHWNSRAEAIAGLNADEAVGMDLWQVYPTLSLSREQIDQALTAQETLYIRQNQSGLYYFNIIIYPLRDQDEPGVVLLIDDVTQKIMAENMLIHNDKMSSMGELAATMAHDINIPLQGILFDLNSFQNLLASGTLLKSESESEKAVQRLKTLLEDASSRAHNVSQIISNLLTFARRRSDKKEAVAITEVMEHAIHLAADVLSAPQQLSFSDIRLERRFATNLPPVPCYVIELQQVFLSLLRHCYDALNEQAPASGEPRIRIVIEEQYEALWIKIEHNGRGLSNQEQMCLFEPYFSNEDAPCEYDPSKRLSFAHFIITDQHQGHMAVTSDPRQGTTFHIQIGLH